MWSIKTLTQDGHVYGVITPKADGQTAFPPSHGKEGFQEAKRQGAEEVWFVCRVWEGDPNGWRFERVLPDGTTAGYSTKPPSWLVAARWPGLPSP